CHSWPQLSITGSWPVIPRRHPAISKDFQRGGDLYINNTHISPVSSCTLLCMALRLCIAQPVKHKHSTHSKTAHS
ncbi:unnamed protein product, partial [Staurois parvus]